MSAATTTVEFNKKLVRTLYDCINARKLDEMEALVAPDFTGPRGEHGPASLRAAISTVLTGFPGVHFELHEVFGEGDRVAVRWTFRASHAGRFAGMAPTHSVVTQEGNVIYQVRDGLIARAWLQADRLGVLQQIGALPPSFADTRARPI